MKIFEKFKYEKNFPHLLFYGSSETDMMSILQIFFHLLFCDKHIEEKVLWLTTIENRNNNFIRTKLKHFCTKKFDTCDCSPLNIVVITGFQFLNNDSYIVLQNFMDIYDKNTKFIYLINNPYDIIDTIKTRCLDINISLSENNNKIWDYCKNSPNWFIRDKMITEINKKTNPINSIEDKLLKNLIKKWNKKIYEPIPENINVEIIIYQLNNIYKNNIKKLEILLDLLHQLYVLNIPDYIVRKSLVLQMAQ